MTVDQAQALIDAVMFVGGLIAANIFASTWRG